MTHRQAKKLDHLLSSEKSWSHLTLKNKAFRVISAIRWWTEMALVVALVTGLVCLTTKAANFILNWVY